jgi:alpha-tubulin suppressor-like RCC1 family protein
VATILTRAALGLSMVPGLLTSSGCDRLLGLERPGLRTGDAGATPDAAASDGGVRPLRVLEIAGGAAHSCARLETGKVKCWGSNNDGQLGLGNKKSKGDGPDEMGDKLPEVDLGRDRTAKLVAAGGAHTCALLDNGRVKCWGSNSSGELGLGDLRGRGGVDNEMGDNLPFVDLGSDASGSPVTVVGLSAGYAHNCALLETHRIKCWGRNMDGQLGLGTARESIGGRPEEMGGNLPAVDLGAGAQVVALAAGGSHTCALFPGGKVKCWGRNEFGQLGLGDARSRGKAAQEMGDNLSFVDLGTAAVAVEIAVGSDHSCARLEPGRVKCWGPNSVGEIGTEDGHYHGQEPGQMGDALPAVDLGGRRSVLAALLAAGGSHGCAVAVLAGGDGLKCWGFNDDGELGQGDTFSRGPVQGDLGDQLRIIDLGAGYRVRALALGYFHTCALLETGRVKCWGGNASGTLGLGDTDARGDEGGELGDHLPPVELGTIAAP